MAFWVVCVVVGDECSEFDLDEDCEIPGPVTRSCFSITILLCSVDDVKVMFLVEKGKGISLNKKEKKMTPVQI